LAERLVAVWEIENFQFSIFNFPARPLPQLSLNLLSFPFGHYAAMRLFKFHTLLLPLILLVASAASKGGAATQTEARDFGKMPDGATVKLFTMRNANGMVARVMTYGATLTELQVPDRRGALTNVVLGADNLDSYLKGFPAASVIGRVANRIAKARFTLDGVEYKLAANSGQNTIHGGRKGFAQVLWQSRPVPQPSGKVRLAYLSRDGEEGYPGNVSVTVTYTLTDNNELRLDYEATTDKATPINLANHGYFNLAGFGEVLDHELWLASDHYTVADDQLIPTGEIAPVKGTPLDFTTPTAIGARIDQLPPKLNGYDHNFVLNRGDSALRLAARVTEPKSGRVLEVRTSEPGVQLYTANHLNGKQAGIGGVVYPKHGAFCLETQHYPDSINHPSFPSTVLRPGQTFKSTTVFAFSTK